MPDFLSADFSSMTVAQLTALCREHKITGYSKQKKAVLVDKLNQYRGAKAKAFVDDTSKTAPSSQLQVPSDVAPSNNVTDAPVVAGPPDDTPIDPVIPSLPISSQLELLVTAKSGNRVSAVNVTRDNSKPTPTTRLSSSKAQNPDIPLSNSSISNLKYISSKRAVPMLSQRLDSGTFKKQRTSSPDRHTEAVSKAHKASITVQKRYRQSATTPLPSSKSSKLSASRSGAQKSRFVPLRPAPRATLDVSPTRVEQAVEQWGMFQSFVVQGDQNFSLQNITIPPSLSQRKIVKSLALLLRDLDDRDRHTCSQASRLLRYAGEAIQDFRRP